MTQHLHAYDKLSNRALLVEANRKLDILIGGEVAILRKEYTMSAAIDRITASVTTITNRDDAILDLVAKLAQEVRDANTSNDPAINTLADQLDASSAKVLDAVNANTTP